jgi:hypothetical protein
MVETPELDKRHKFIESGETDTLTRFYDWLCAKNYFIAEWIQPVDDDGEPEGDEMLFSIRIGPERLFADFFGIDLDKVESERRAILEEIRSKN